MSPEPAASIPATDSPTVEGRSFLNSRALLIVAFLVAASWILGLVILAAVSANPVTINQKQIRALNLIVIAKRTADGSSSLNVTKEWTQGEELGTITVTNLEQTNMPAETECIVPLRRLDKGRFQVTPTSLPNEAPLVYPLTPEAESQLQNLLESFGR